MLQLFMLPFQRAWHRAGNLVNHIISLSPLKGEEALRLKHTLVFIILGILLILFYGLSNILQAEKILGTLLVVSASGIIGSWISLFFIPSKKILYRLNIYFLGLVFIYGFLIGGEDGSFSLWMLIFPPIITFLLNKKEGLILSLLFLLILMVGTLLPIPLAQKYHYSTAYLLRYFWVYMIISSFSYWFEHFRASYRSELQKAHLRFTEILRNSRDILYRRDLNSGHYQYLSKAFFIHLGYEESEFEALSFAEVASLIHPDDIDHHNQVISKILKKGSPATPAPPIELRMRCKSGEYLWFSDEITFIYDDNDKPEAIIGVSREITEQRQIKHALEESKDQFMTILDSLPAHVYVADMESYQILFMNKKMMEDFGNELEGKICWKEFHKETGPCPHCTNHLLLNENNEPAIMSEWESHSPLLNKWYNNYDRAIQWLDGRWVRLQIAVDITRQKYLEAERKRTAEYLEAENKRNAEIINRAQQLDAIGTLAGGIAHDFNNLLQTILGNISLADSESAHSEKLQTYLAESKRAVLRAGELANKMMELSPVDSNNKITLPLDIFLEQISSETPADKEITRSLLIAPDLWQIAIDYNQITTAFKNIITNSYENMKKAGKLTIIAGNKVIAKTVEQIPHPIRPGSYVKLQFIDDGVGIPEKNIPKIFDPYFTTKEKGSSKGIGLGLAITHAIIRRHDGYIFVNSSQKAGTEVTIYLPYEVKRSPQNMFN